MVHIIFGNIIKIKNIKIVGLIGVFFVTTTLSEHLFGLIKSAITQKIVSKITIKLESAIVFRTISMPVNFFEKLNSGEIFARINLLKLYCHNLINSVLNSGLNCALMLIYFFQIFTYAPIMIAPTLATVISFLAFGTFAATTRSKIGFKRMKLQAAETSTILELISGIEKIKLTGSEKPVFSLWANKFAQSLKFEYNPPTTLKISKIVLNAIKLFGTISTYVVAAICEIKPANFFAFSLAFSTLNDSFFNLATTAIEFAKIKPISKLLEPIFKTYPEPTHNKKIITHLKGSIEVNNLSFSYNKNKPNILEQISFKISPKQTIALVGKSGCGKSTLVRLLIGFEKPASGSIFFDENNLNTLNLQILRKKIGIVVENDKLFNGNIFLNIATKNKNLSLKEAWFAAKIAQIDEDIAKMPMKMNTLIVQEGKEFSASQVQRILIARAIATKPKILILDEATSELEAKIQSRIFKQLKQLNCTTIVATNNPEIFCFCDKIIKLDN